MLNIVIYNPEQRTYEQSKMTNKDINYLNKTHKKIEQIIEIDT